MKGKIFRLYPKNGQYLLLITLGGILNGMLVYLSAQTLSSLVDDVLKMGLSRGLEKNGKLLAVLLILGILRYMTDYRKEVLLEQNRYSVIEKVFSRILRMRGDEKERRGSAEFFQMTGSDLDNAAGFYQKLDEGMRQAAGSLGAILYIFRLDWRVGISLLILGGILLFYNGLISPRFGAVQDKIQADDCHVRNIAMQEYDCREYRPFYNFQLLDRIWEKAYKEYIQACMKKAGWQAITSVFGYLLGFLQTYLPLLLAAVWIKNFSVGDILALISNVTLFMGIFRSAGDLMTGTAEAMAGGGRILRFLDMTAEEQAAGGIRPCLPMTVKVSGLQYNYGSSPGTRVSGWEWESGSPVGIVGEKGCGKSTFLKIFLGLLRDYQGSLMINGQEVRTLDCGWAAYLSQDFPVLDMTIRENFSLAAPEKSQEEYMQYAALVNMDKEILRMPQGLDTQVNAREISTGQRQRLSLCMALLRDTPCVVLDEPVSSLDRENRAIVRRLLREGGRQYVIVSHETDIFSGGDRIYHFPR